MRAEDLKEWLRGAEEEEDPETGDSREDAGDRWPMLERLIQEVWHTGYIPQQLCWVIVVLIPKGGDDYQGIGLLEMI